MSELTNIAADAFAKILPIVAVIAMVGFVITTVILTITTL